jgi:hypothetical protein
MDITSGRSAAILRLSLRSDAAIVAVAGIALAIGADPVGDLLALDPLFLRTVGIALLPWAGWVAWVSQHPTEASVRSVIAGNALWVIASVLALLLPGIDPNALGMALVLLQAALVAAIVWWQLISLRSVRTV